jgi:HlyD family secretion protein
MKYFVFFVFATFITGCTPGNDCIVESTGTIEATQVDIRSEVAGRILKLAFDEGDRVKPDDVLAAIDHEKMDMELQSAEGRLREAEARFALLESGFRKEDVQKSQEALQEAEIVFKNAKREYERVQKLYADKVAPENTRDTIETNYKSALKRYERARQDYQMLQSGYRAEDIAAGLAVKESAQAAVNLIMRRIKDATIASPCKGIISERYVEPGELVSVGSVLFSIIDLQDMWIMAYVSEKNLGKVKIGQAAAVSVDSFPGRTFPGKVIYISPEAEFTPKNIQTKEERVKLVYGIKVQIQNDEELLKPGMPADVAIAIEPSK